MFRRPPWGLGRVKTMTKLEAQSSAQISNDSPIVDVLLGGCIVSDMYVRNELCESVCARMFKRICAKKGRVRICMRVYAQDTIVTQAIKIQATHSADQEVQTKKQSDPLA